MIAKLQNPVVVVALSLTSLTSVAYGAFLMWAFIG